MALLPFKKSGPAAAGHGTGSGVQWRMRKDELRRLGCSRSGTISVSNPPLGLRQDWSRQLPVPVKVGRRKLRSLDDIRRHLLDLPDHQQGSQVWQHALWYAMKAAEGGDISRAEAAFRLALMPPPRRR